MDNLALLQAVGRGSHGAFSELYETFRPTMLAYATGILAGDSSSAEDAVDEAFTDIWRLSGRFNAVSNATAWIRRIVKNKSIDIVRKGTPHELGQPTGFFEQIEDSSANPEDNALLSDDRRYLREALSALNSDQREVVHLCYFEGLSMEEISAETNSHTSTVKTRLFYARKKMLKWMQDRNFEINIYDTQSSSSLAA